MVAFLSFTVTALMLLKLPGWVASPSPFKLKKKPRQSKGKLKVAFGFTTRVTKGKLATVKRIEC